MATLSVSRTRKERGDEDVFFVSLYREGFTSLDVGAGYNFEDALLDCFFCPRNKKFILTNFENVSLTFGTEVFCLSESELNAQNEIWISDSNFRRTIFKDEILIVDDSEIYFCILYDIQVDEYFYAASATFYEAVCGAFAASPRIFGEFTVLVTTDKRTYEEFDEDRGI